MASSWFAGAFGFSVYSRIGTDYYKDNRVSSPKKMVYAPKINDAITHLRNILNKSSRAKRGNPDQCCITEVEIATGYRPRNDRGLLMLGKG